MSSDDGGARTGGDEAPPFQVSKQAAAEIRRSMDLGDAHDMGLRIAARRLDDGAIDYAMGFDERAPGDLVVMSAGVEVLIGEGHRDLLAGTRLDYVEMEAGVYSFIFMNPNDPHYVPPSDTESGG